MGDRTHPRGRITLAAVTAVAAAAGVGLAAGATDASARRPEVVLVTQDCSSATDGGGNFLCSDFARAVKATHAHARIVAPDFREDPADTLSLLARQGNDLVITDFLMADPLAEVARRLPRARFGIIDAPLTAVPGSPRNVAAIVLAPTGAAYLAGWLGARMAHARPGPATIGIVAGQRLPPVDAFTVGIRAGALRAVPGIRVLTTYSGDFNDPNKCEAIARRQIAQGARVVYDVAGGCGPGTLRAAKQAGVWAVGVDRDRSGLGPFVLTSMVKRYDNAARMLIRGVDGGRSLFGRTTVLTLREGGSGLGRISPRVPARVIAELGAVRRGIVAGRIRLPPTPG